MSRAISYALITLIFFSCSVLAYAFQQEEPEGIRKNSYRIAPDAHARDNSAATPAGKYVEGYDTYTAYQPWLHYSFIPPATKQLKHKRNIVVALIGNGVNYNHPALKGHFWQNPGEVNGKPGVDDDHNGWVDDIYGIDTWNYDSQPLEESPAYHTMMGGTLLSTANYSGGESFVGNGKVKLMVIKCCYELPDRGIWADDLSTAAAIEYAVKKGADIIQIFGGVRYHPDVKKAIKSFKGLIVTWVKPDSEYNYLLHLGNDKAISVFGYLKDYDIDDNGDGKTALDIAAYGHVNSTFWNGNYYYYGGSRSAASLITGYLASAKASFPGLSDIQLKETMKSSAEIQPKFVELNLLEGVGMLNIYRAALARSSGGMVYTGDWALLDEKGPLTRTKPVVIAYDSGRKTLVMYGGGVRHGNNVKDTESIWEWDGKSWREIPFKKGFLEYPGWLSDGTMVYDERRGVIVLNCAGVQQNSAAYFQYMWEWNGKRWLRNETQLYPRGEHSRYWGSMVYNSKRGAMMFYGGYGYPSNSKRFDLDPETWEYDGIGWRKLPAKKHPPRRCYYSISYDAARDVVVMYGGYDYADNKYDDTWEYNGKTWRRSKAQGLYYLSDPQLIYNTNRQRVMLFTGMGSFGHGELEMLELKDDEWQIASFHNPYHHSDHSIITWDNAGNRAYALIGSHSWPDYEAQPYKTYTYTNHIDPIWVDNLITGGADFTGDGAANIATWNPATGQWSVKGQQPVAIGARGDIPAPADYDGDGVTEMATYRRAIGQWIFSGSTVKFGKFDDIPVPADYDGDGKDDIAVYRRDRSLWLIKGQPSKQYGLPADLPVPGDYNGDGLIELATYTPLTATWHIKGIGHIQWGEPGESPVPADYDGDGRLDIATFNMEKRMWKVRNWTDGDMLIKTRFGKKWDIPVPGDYNGDGITELATFHPMTGTWFIQGSPPVKHGKIGDVPLVRGN